jgi:hypothetical protein
MKRAPSVPSTEELLMLGHELAEAHLDTVELALGGPDEPGWAAHLDYLRALRRKAEELLARAASPEAAS